MIYRKMKGRIRVLLNWWLWNGWVVGYSLSWNLVRSESRMRTRSRITRSLSSREEFAMHCSGEMLSDSQSGVFDQQEFAMYLTELCVEEELCEENEALSFESLPTLMQLKFAWAICPKNETAFEACVDQLQDKPDEPIGIDISNNPDFLYQLCHSIHAQILQMGLLPHTNSPTSAPSLYFSSSPSMSPTMPPNNTVSTTTSTQRGLSDRSIAGISIAAAGVVLLAGILLLFRSKQQPSQAAVKEELYTPRTDATNKSQWVDDSVSSIGFEEDEEDPVRQLEQAVLARDWKRVGELASELSSIDSGSSLSLSTQPSQPTQDLERLDELIQSCDWVAVGATATLFSKENNHSDRLSPTRGTSWYSKAAANATTHDYSLNLNVMAATSAVIAQNAINPPSTDSTPSVTSTSQNDYHHTDHLSTDSSIERIINPQHNPVIIEGTYHTDNSISSLPNKRKKSWRKRLSFVRKKKMDGTHKMQMALALQEDSSVSSWSNGSSPGNSSCFTPHSIYEDSSFQSSDDNDQSSDKSAISLRDELDRAIESGDWAAVQTHTALILDDNNTNDTENSYDQHDPHKSGHQHDSFQSETLQSETLQRRRSEPDWRTVLNDVSNTHTHSSTAGSLTDYHSCHSQNYDSSFETSPPRLYKQQSLPNDIESSTKS